MSRQSLMVVAKLLFSAALVAFLVNRVQFGPLLARLQNIDAAWATLAFATFMALLVVAGCRYGLIVRVLGFVLPPKEAIRLFLIGHFFSQTLPSAIGGDAVRAYMTMRLGMGWARAVSAVLCDRAVGLLVLLVIATLTIPLYLGRITEPYLRSLAFLPAFAAATGLAILAVAGPGRMAWLARWRIVRPFVVLVGDMRRIVMASRESALIALISVAAQLGTVTSVWLLARALQLEIGYLDCLVLIPPILVVTLVPISIAGWGVREGAMIFGFALIGVPEADSLALSVATGLCQMAAGLPGGLLWLSSGRPGVGTVPPSGA